MTTVSNKEQIAALPDREMKRRSRKKPPAVCENHLLTVDEVAARLGCSRRHAHTLAKKGHMKKIRLSTRCVRFEAADVEAFIARVRGDA